MVMHVWLHGGAENGINGPVLLANHDNSSVFDEHEAHIAQGDITTL
jgi:hypothetical protein